MKVVHVAVYLDAEQAKLIRWAAQGVSSLLMRISH